ncbi:MAG: IS110 family transposase, partial [Gammaproteobacteria bacterium]|nr:IS110 family transposase [Gammaproteobacteria bacterium]
VMQLDAKRIVMEACYSSNYWGRVFQQNGYEVNLIPPHQVKPFVVGNKNDSNDAVAIAEAALRPRASFVRVKSYEQQDVQSLDKIRHRLIKARTALANQMRGLLAEYGLVFKAGIRTLITELPFALEDAENELTYTAREFLRELEIELLYLTERIKQVEQTADKLLAQNDDYLRLQSIPGIGPTISRAMISSINDANQFNNGRQMAAWIGITPKQHASGDRSRMGGISKRGNQTLRRQLIHG